MPYNPDGSFSLVQSFGTGTPPSNDFPPQVGQDLDDIATNINIGTIISLVGTLTVAASFDSIVIASPTGGNKGSGSLNAAGTIYQNNNAAFIQTQTATGGVVFSPHDFGTVSSGTIAPSAAVCAKQQVTNNGAFTISGASVGVGDTELLVVNAASAGTITVSSFTKQFTGDVFDTTNGHAFVVYIYGYSGSRTACIVKALQ